jgi:anti-sigma B factor antagonist
VTGHDDDLHARPFGLTRTDLGGATTVVTVSGELDLQSAPELMAVVDQAMRAPGADVVVVDLTEVWFLGSSGLGVLANLATRATVPTSHRHDAAEARAQLRVVSPPDNHAVTRPWEAMSLQQILPLYPTISSAVQGGAGG